MNLTGLILNLICLLIVITIVMVYPYTKKITSKYLFWCILGIIWFSYLFAGRFLYSLIDLSHFNNNQYDSSSIISNALLLDLCPFVSFFIPLCLMFDKSRKLACTLSYFAIFGGLINMVGIMFSNDANSGKTAIWSAKYIFLGISKNDRLYFMMHFLQIIFGVLILLNSKVKLWRDFLNCTIFFACFIVYVLFMINIFNVAHGATGLVPGDWDVGGEYYQVAVFLQLPFPIIALVTFGIVGLIIFGIISLFEKFQRNGKYSCLPQNEYQIS